MTLVRRRELSGVDLAILRIVQDHPCHGMGTLTQKIAAYNQDYVSKRVRRLHAGGQLEIDVPPLFGRGHKIIIRKAGAA